MLIKPYFQNALRRPKVPDCLHSNANENLLWANTKNSDESNKCTLVPAALRNKQVLMFSILLNYPYMAIYKNIATGPRFCNSLQSNSGRCCIIVCTQNYSLHYPRFIVCINTSNFMHMDTVGLSRGAADCSETNFTIISFGGGERLRVFIYQISENDKLHKLRGGSRKDERVSLCPQWKTVSSLEKTALISELFHS